MSKNQITRREFLKSTAITGTGIVSIPWFLPPIAHAEGVAHN
ncbi:MAG: twin-arginine translocation signal domain-containing protein [Cardiobacteriaceae bacterium]|nr:twin-arginine translocation signal domain-containing protein [Cardiobacteriaceae bacterium]